MTAPTRDLRITLIQADTRWHDPAGNRQLYGDLVRRQRCVVEARAPDGLVEAFSVESAPGFNLCVQWHPEWKAASNPVSMRLLRAFGDACRSFRDRPRAPQPAR